MAAAHKYAYINSSYFSRLTYSWATGLIYLMTKKEINEDDLWMLQDSELASKCKTKISLEWSKELLKPSPNRSLKRSILRALVADVTYIFFIQNFYM